MKPKSLTGHLECVISMMVRPFLLLFLLISGGALAQKHNYLLVGTYTKGKSTGIYVYDFDEKNATTKIVDSIQSPNPSYLAISPDQKYVYAVSETVRGHNSGKVRAFSFDKKTGQLQFINEQSSMGDNPCYLAVDKKGKWVAVGNYTSGTVAVLPIQKGGRLGAAVSSVTHLGRSAHPQRQASPHVHSTVFSPDNQYLFVPDLGIDRIMVYSMDENTGMLRPAKDSFVKLPDGSGPRHFEFHPSGSWAYLMEELSGAVTSFSYDNGKLLALQSVSCVPPEYRGYFTSADIHVSKDGKFVYASTRDSLNNITIFKIEPESGKLSWVGQQSTLGRTPRNFNFDPSFNFLLVANQNSDNIVIFRIDKKTGLLTDTGKRIDVGNPVCIKWIK